jgi:hypothetical protein
VVEEISAEPAFTDQVIWFDVPLVTVAKTRRAEPGIRLKPYSGWLIPIATAGLLPDEEEGPDGCDEPVPGGGVVVTGGGVVVTGGGVVVTGGGVVVTGGGVVVAELTVIASVLDIPAL